MKTWKEAITEKFVVTYPSSTSMTIWGKTRSGKKSRAVCGWDIYNAISKMPECQTLFRNANIGVYDRYLKLFS